MEKYKQNYDQLSLNYHQILSLSVSLDYFSNIAFPIISIVAAFSYISTALYTHPTHGNLSVCLLCRLLTVSCLKKNRFGEIVSSGPQSLFQMFNQP